MVTLSKVENDHLGMLNNFSDSIEKSLKETN